MRHLPFIFLACLLLIARPAPAATPWRATESIPGHDPILVSVEGKARTYFRLDSSAPLEISVTGPSRLQIITRARVVGARPATVSYRVWIDENGSRVRERFTRSVPSKRAGIARVRGAVYKSHSFTYNVPSGRHELRLYAESVPPGTGQGATGVLARIRVAGDPTERPMVSLTPVEAMRSVTVREGEKLIPYYTVAPKQPVRVRVVGPAELELTSRLDFDDTMRGTQSYRLEVWESERRIRQIGLVTSKSSADAYTDLKDRVASKGSRIHIPVGPGTHELSIHLVQPKRGSAEIHLRIPRPPAGAER